MKCRTLPLLLLCGTGVAVAQFPPQIKNVIVIVQENRTPDNLFHALSPACPLPKNPASPLEACIPSPVTDSCYDVSPCGLSDRKGTPPVPVTLKPVRLSGSVDPDHSHEGFNNMCNPDPVTLKCRNDGAWKTSSPAGASYGYVYNRPITNYDGSAGGLLEPYLILAKQYGWANYMFQTNQGPSYPAHQFLFSGTSALTAEDDRKATFVAGNPNSQLITDAAAGCLAPKDETNRAISPAIDTPDPGCTLYADSSVQVCPTENTKLNYPTDPVGSYCAHHESMATLLNPRGISWKYYAPSAGSIWTAPDAIKSICEPQFAHPNDPGSPLECAGKEFQEHVDLNYHGTDILRDIASCDLAQVNWVIPDGAWSDHAGEGDLYGPSWVAAVVNAVGSHRRCGKGTKDEGQAYWENTAIVITWDDWGGWSDNQPAPYTGKLPCNSKDCQADYQYGFRVPLLVVSAYTPAGYINNVRHDFGSILRMIEGVNRIPEGQLGFADARSSTDLRDFFSLTQPRPYTVLPAEKDAGFFLNYTAPVAAPDND